jgi:hypothetical protein
MDGAGIGSREVTKDIDAYVAAPTEPTRRAAADVALQLGLPVDWLNDGIKGFFYTTPPQELWQEFAGLAVYTVTSDYMLETTATCKRCCNIFALLHSVRS